MRGSLRHTARYKVQKLPRVCCLHSGRKRLITRGQVTSRKPQIGRQSCELLSRGWLERALPGEIDLGGGAGLWCCDARCEGQRDGPEKTDRL